MWGIKISKDKTNARLIGDKADGTDDCSSSASGEVGLLYTPSTVSSWDRRGIWHAITSAKEESVLKSRKKQRDKSSDLT